ncbi:swim zinc finger family protein [Neofusicoccum parvum]|uniref:Swim zinc finger family protein n=2 Tax=Neofusicoccum parvum TaxID=310453 RepID=A0ACB5S6M7_9PEZI|nr:putative swim zinc finger family protein [Neofusicoccum parvum UCRNP2]GME28408.1 swim zinc finger family protein [Neofusicoccum parvum]GME52132.1 swim zinc finger family protein [Neofusicoccum parvum]
MSFVLLEDGRITGPPESAGMDLIHANEIMDAILKRADNPRGWRILHRQAADDDRSETRTEEYEELEDRIEILCWAITPREAVKKEFSKCSSVNVDDEKILNDVFEGFKRLIQEFAANNQDFQTALGKILTTEFCISAELARMTLRYVEVFRRLDAASNPQSTQRSTDLKQGADMLKRIVEEIFEFYEDSVGTADHTWYVAGMLIEILRSVVERNYNMYERVQGAIANSSPQDNNLYVRLIGDPPAGNPQRFLVDMLFEQIPQKILVKHLSNLQSIGRILREHGGNNQYIQYFETNVAKLERSGAQGGSSRR